MSYEIYKSVTQLGDGTFECVSSSNNVYPHHFGKWNMKYFNDEFPNATNEERKACWMIYSTYTGDKFYQANWKKLQKLGNQFMMEHGYTYEDICKDKIKWLQYAREFLLWKKEKSKIKMKKYVVSMIFNSGRLWITKKTSARVFGTEYKPAAKIFKAYCKEDLERLLSGYSSHELIVEEV